jgi:hypothetical protein
MAAECEAVDSGPPVEVAVDVVFSAPAELDGVDEVGVTAVLLPHTKLRQKVLVARLVEAATHSFFHSSHSREGRVCW